MYYRILGANTIQLSDNYRDGYSSVVVDEKPSYNPMTEHVESYYQVVGSEVHQSWRIVEGESDITDAEALDIIKGL